MPEDPRLVEVARRHAEDMARRSYFAHKSPEGSDPGDRLSAAGVSWRSHGENIARGHPSDETAFEAWMKSPGHRKNLDDCTWTHHGLGVHESYRVHIFAKLR